MKRILLWIMILYVLGVAILQGLNLTVRTKEDKLDATYPSFVQCSMTGEVTKAWGTSSYDILYVSVQESGWGVQCYVPKDSNYEIGQTLILKGEFSKPEAPTNPGEFHQVNYYKARQVDFLCFTPEITVVSQGEDSLLLTVKRGLYSFKERLAKVYDRTLHKDMAGCIKAIVLGDKKDLPEAINALFQKNGIAHILAISGLHIGCIGGAVYKLLRRLGISYGASGCCGILFLCGYGYLTGVSDSTVRAAVMLSIYIVGDVLGRTYDLLTAMSISMMCMLIHNPMKLYDAGVLLSYGAIAGIGVLYPAFKKAFPIKSKLLNGLMVSLSVSLMTLPVSLYFYGAYSPYSIFLNLVVIPLMTPLLFLSLAGGMVGLLSLQVAKWLLWLPTAILWLYEWLCNHIIELPGAYLILGRMEVWQIILYYLALLGLVWTCNCKDKWKCAAWISMMIFLCAGALGLACLRVPVDRMVMLDVGQGDCILLETKSGLQILVDGGSTSEKKVGEYRILPALKSYGVRKLDYVILTHADGDHMNGLTYLLEMADQHEVEIGSFMMAESCMELEEYQELSQLATFHGVKVKGIHTGMELVVDDFCITCLHPDHSYATEDMNDMSVVLLVQYGAYKALLTGDLTEAGEHALLKYGKWLKDVDVLKVGHHGSKYSSSEPFLSLTSPEYALISCGAENSYGHPHTETIERLQKVKSEIWMTKQMGALVVEFGREIRVRGYRTR